MDIGKAIKTIRIEKGIRQADLVKRIGARVNTNISKIENGHTDPTLETVARIADGLGVSASELVQRAEELS